jgi:hypothetical protein
LYANDTYDEHQYATVRSISQYRYARIFGAEPSAVPVLVVVRGRQHIKLAFV